MILSYIHNSQSYKCIISEGDIIVYDKRHIYKSDSEARCQALTQEEIRFTSGGNPTYWRLRPVGYSVGDGPAESRSRHPIHSDMWTPKQTCIQGCEWHHGVWVRDVPGSGWAKEVNTTKRKTVVDRQQPRATGSRKSPHSVPTPQSIQRVLARWSKGGVA
jgi:hypothetical protein